MHVKKAIKHQKLFATNLPEKSIISAQFVKVIEPLIEDKKVESGAELLSNYGYSRSVISHIKKGTQNAPIDLLYEIVFDYRINFPFLFALSNQVRTK